MVRTVAACQLSGAHRVRCGKTSENGRGRPWCGRCSVYPSVCTGWLPRPRYGPGPGTPTWVDSRALICTEPVVWGRQMLGECPQPRRSSPSSVQLQHLTTWLTVQSRHLDSSQSKPGDLRQSHRALACRLIKWKRLLASFP